MGSGYYLQYGQRKMVGITAFVDADTKRRFGIEAEGRWLEYHQTANVHAETYSIGGRYHFDVGRFAPYAKGLVGFGDFNFPYNYALWALSGRDWQAADWTSTGRAESRSAPSTSSTRTGPTSPSAT